MTTPWERTMPFGKHRGEPLGDIPRDYLEWAKDQAAGKMTPSLLAAVKTVLTEDRPAPGDDALDVVQRENAALRHDLSAARARIASLESRPPAAANLDGVRLAIRQAYGRLSRQFHPDAGGDTRQQAALNAFHEAAVKAIEEAAR